MRQERVALALDKPAVLDRHPCVFPAPGVIQSIAQVAHHMEFVEDNLGLGRMAHEGVAEWLPHVHDDQIDTPTAGGPHLNEESVHILLTSTQERTHPDGPFLFKIGHHEGVVVPFSDGDFIDSDDLEPSGRRMLGQKVPHVSCIHTADLVPGEPVHLGDLLDRHGPTLFADKPLETFGEAPGLGQPSESFLFHCLTVSAEESAVFELNMNPGAAGVQVSHLMYPAVIETSGGLPA